MGICRRVGKGKMICGAWVINRPGQIETCGRSDHEIAEAYLPN